jgi:hypothetical protein
MRKNVPTAKEKKQGEYARQALKKINAAGRGETFTSKPSSPTQQIERLRYQAANALYQLREIAKKDMSALEVLATVLQNHTGLLKQDALENLAHYRKLTRICSMWPAFVSVNKDIQSAQISFADAIQLGADAPLNYRSKGKRGWSMRTPENFAAMELINLIQRRGDKLPPLTRAAAAQWWRHARTPRVLHRGQKPCSLFEAYYGERFEKHPLFARKYQTKIWTPDDPDDPKKRLKYRATWERKQILDKMAQAFHSIARKD